MKKKAASTLRVFSEKDVDGFPTDTPEWVTYCPRCGLKLPLAEHETCPNFQGEESAAGGEATGVRCAYDAEARPQGEKKKD